MDRAKALGVYLLALLVFNLAACASMQAVELPAGGYAPEAVEVGSQVEVLTLEGVQHRFTVTEVDEKGIGGKPGFFRYDEISSLQLKVPGEGAILLAVAVGLALGFLFWYAVDEAVKTSISPAL